ncbi:MAG: ribose-5-phosphate isomerase RpiA [Chloroflexia bacterium]
MAVDELKRAAALRAVEYVRDGMSVGLGTGSTAQYAVRELGRRVREDGLKIRGVPTSDRTAALATEVGIPLTTLEECPRLDVTIDGADELVLGTLDAIKGMGGALLHEKIVALATEEEILILDESKVVPRLGDHTSVPVEVVSFGWSRTCHALRALGCQPVLRLADGGEQFITDSGNLLIDCRFPSIEDPYALAAEIKTITGVVDHGLFLGIARRAIVAGASGIREINV